MEWNNRQSKQQLVFDQRQQIQRIFSHFQHVIALGQVLTARPLIDNGVIAFAVNGQNNRLQTTLANHLDVNIELTMDNHSTLLVAPECKTGTHHTLIIFKRLGESLKLRQAQLALQASRPISKLARINVRRYRSFQHKRGILWMRPMTVKGIQPAGRTEHIELRTYI